MRSRQYVREASSYLAGACPEGLGGTVFEQWMLEAEDLDSILKRIQRISRLADTRLLLCQSVKTGQDISGVRH
ncbi:MAG: hypothetical protein ACLTBV_27930 [Enterocloster bolteae]